MQSKKKVVLITGASSGMGMDFAKTLSKNMTEDAIKQISNEGNNIDILINNAGFGMFGSIEDIDIQDARYQFEVNLFGLAELTKLVIPGMRENKYGKIINISSIMGHIYMPLSGWYTATKHALEGWSDSLRTELSQFNIDVIIIEPGSIKTEFTSVSTEKLIKHSKNSLYKEMTESMLKRSEEANKNKIGLM
uniref:Uncharacterized protein n=1 Tax=Biomphalaria glabrata TaxID=6526 RepID=A0A2C9KK59_BIOGL